MRTFEDFKNFVVEEAAAEGPAALADLAAKRLLFQLAVQLAEARKAQGLTQVELSKRSGVPQSEISKVEGGGNVTEMTLFRVASGLGCELVLTSPRKSRGTPSSAPRASTARQHKRVRANAARLAKGRKSAKTRPAAVIEELHAP